MEMVTGMGEKKLRQPDILVFDVEEGVIYIIDCKLTHTDKVWPQLEEYKAILKVIFPEFQFRMIEMCRHLSVGNTVIKRIDGLAGASGGEYYVWRYQ